METQALLIADAERRSDENERLLMFERLASNKDIDVEKLQRLIDMQERILAHDAESAFNAAFAEMQADIPEIDERGRILNREGTVQSHYAKNEDIQKVLRPILKQHGFSLAFETQWPDKTTVKVLGILTHRDGHKRTSEFLAGADTSGSKNAIQALGSSISYGHRYTTCDLLNITSREPSQRDDDGERSEMHKQPASPDGYESFVLTLEAEAAKGLAALEKAFSAGDVKLRNHLLNHNAKSWAALKNRARGARS